MPLVAIGLLLLGGTVQAGSEPDTLGLSSLETARVREMAMLASSGSAHTPFLASFRRSGELSIVLPARSIAYSIAELRLLFPHSFTENGDAVLLRDHIVAAEGATLDIRGPIDLRLRSDADHVASIAGWRATIRIGGGGPVSISSWDPAGQAPDAVLADRRAFILVRGGQMNITDATFRYLGFGPGITSGVAWKGLSGQPSRGNVSRSRFENNQFGAYTFESDSMRWTDNVFADNVVYGFDPHDYSNGFFVEGNEAFGNGSHGIIFSRGCSGNVITGNSSHDNGGHGIVLDDGKVQDDGVLSHAAAVPSNENVISNNRVWNNTVGIALEGGSGNVIRDNKIDGNRFGTRLKNDASRNQIVDNTITGSLVFGVYVYKSSNENDIARNRVVGGQGGFVFKDAEGNRLIGNKVLGVVGHAVAVIGHSGVMVITGNSLSGKGSSAVDLLRATDASGIHLDNGVSSWVVEPGFRPAKWLGDLLRAHPMLPLWVSILGLPFMLSLSRTMRRRVPGAQAAGN